MLIPIFWGFCQFCRAKPAKKKYDIIICALLKYQVRTGLKFRRVILSGIFFTNNGNFFDSHSSVFATLASTEIDMIRHGIKVLIPEWCRWIGLWIVVFFQWVGNELISLCGINIFCFIIVELTLKLVKQICIVFRFNVQIIVNTVKGGPWKKVIATDEIGQFTRISL